MRRQSRFFGTYVPTGGWLHRTRVLLKLGAVAAISIVVLALRNPVVDACVFAVLLACGLTSRLRLGQVLSPLRAIWIFVALIIAFHLIFSDAANALVMVSKLIVCVQAAGLLMLTSSIGQLLEAFAVLVRPLRFLGVDAERVALTAALTVRSIPFMAQLVGQSADAARARGLERSIQARSVPVVLGAVKFAQDTGRALDARGLGD